MLVRDEKRHELTETLAAIEGDAVFGQAAGCLGSHVVADAAALTRLPCSMNLPSASTMPTAFLTAAAAFQNAAGLQAGDRCAAGVSVLSSQSYGRQCSLISCLESLP